MGRGRRDVIRALGDPATFWSVVVVGLVGSALAGLSHGWGWAWNLVAVLLTVAVYLLVARPDDPTQPRLVTRLGRSLTRRP